MTREHLRGFRLGYLFHLVTLSLLLSIPAQGQEESFDPRKAVKAIQDGFDSILESLNEMAADDAARPGEEVVKNIDDLLKSMQGAQDSVVKNIDDLIKNQKSQSGNQSGSSSSQNQKQQNKPGKQQQDSGQKRDRNQSEGKPEEEGGKPEPKDGKPQEQGQPDGSDASKKKDQTQSGRQPSQKPQEVYQQILEAGGWGFLPDEMKQQLIESNFRDWFPDYDREIRDYLKSLAKPRKRR